jgi:NADPH:quinone reductase-like Zn-dependent oxidoreductase
MKAIIYEKYGSPDVLVLKEIEKPVPKDNEILIKIFATTITTVDSIFRKGDSFFARLATGITKPKNKILGTEFSGVVESVGKEVKLFKPGDKVFGDSSKKSSTHAEYICLSEDEPVITIPSNLSFEEAASIPYGTLTALPFLRDNGKIKAGQKVLIIGASGAVGTYAVQFAKHFDANVTGVCSTSNIELVKSLGTDKVIDYTKEDFSKSGEKYNIIFDTVGKSSFNQCKKSLTENGIYLTTVVGLQILKQMLLTSKAKKKAIVAFTGLRSSKDRTKDLVYIKELIEAGKIKPVIDKYFSFDKFIDAHAYVDKGHKKGNVVISVLLT